MKNFILTCSIKQTWTKPSDLWSKRREKSTLISWICFIFWYLHIITVGLWFGNFPSFWFIFVQISVWIVLTCWEVCRQQHVAVLSFIDKFSICTCGHRDVVSLGSQSTGIFQWTMPIWGNNNFANGLTLREFFNFLSKQINRPP